MTYNFVKTDAGRANSKRPKQKNDCTVRAIALATNSNYDEVYDILAKAGRKCSDGFHIKEWLQNYVDSDIRLLGFKVTRKVFQAIKGQKRMNPVTFSKEYSIGTYIVKTAQHVFVFINGVAYDTEKERDDRCIYSCWKLEK